LQPIAPVGILLDVSLGPAVAEASAVLVLAGVLASAEEREDDRDHAETS